MRDLLTIEDLELLTRIGIPEEERKNPQRVLVTVEIRLKPQGTHDDDLTKSMDYAVIDEKLRSIASSEHNTIEGFAEEIAKDILSEKAAESVLVCVQKFVLPGAKSTKITIERMGKL